MCFGGVYEGDCRRYFNVFNIGVSLSYDVSEFMLKTCVYDKRLNDYFHIDVFS